LSTNRSAIATACAGDGRNSPHCLKGRLVTTMVDRTRVRAHTTRNSSLAASRPRSVRRTGCSWRARAGGAATSRSRGTCTGTRGTGRRPTRSSSTRVAGRRSRRCERRGSVGGATWPPRPGIRRRQRGSTREVLPQELLEDARSSAGATSPTGYVPNPPPAVTRVGFLRESRGVALADAGYASPCARRQPRG
jgi:hypothetical protein